MKNSIIMIRILPAFSLIFSFLLIVQVAAKTPVPNLNRENSPTKPVFLPIVVKPGFFIPSPCPPLPPGVKTYYLSPDGDDQRSGLSEAGAWATFDHAWPYLNPGDTLIVLDGIYYQSINPGVRNGENCKPIMVRAKNDGKVIIDGEFQRVPLQLDINYFLIEGIIAKNSPSSVYLIRGNNNILRRVSGYNANKDDNAHVFTVAESKNNLIEDCIASGSGRKMAFTWEGESNVIRRCFTNWQQYDARDFGGEWPWGENLELYNSSDSIIENSISYGSAPKTAVSVLGNINSAGDKTYTRNNKILGVISIRNGIFKDGSVQWWPITRPQPTESTIVSRWREWAGWRLGFGVILWGEEADVSNTLFQDIFSWGNAGLGFAEIHPYNPSSNMRINRATIYNNGLDAPIGDGGIGTDVDLNQISHYSITNSRIAGTPYQGAGARFQYRYINGQLMDGTNGYPAQPLWPWPMQDRILTELGIDVTGELTKILQDANIPTGKTLPAPTISPLPPPGDIVSGAGTVSYLSPVEVTLSTPVAGAVIRYTVDSSEPTLSSPHYTGPILISQTTILKTKAFQNEKESHSRSAYFKIQTNLLNKPPRVEAALLPFVYPKAEIMLPINQIGLYGIVKDETLPKGTSQITSTWSVISGPTGVEFSDTKLPRTNATFSQPGTYVLRLTANDGQFSRSADVNVTVLREGGSLFNLTSRIEAEDFKAGGEGVGYHDSTNGSNTGFYRPNEGVDLDIAYNENYGYAVIDMTPGEWMAYNVAAPQTGYYTMKIRVAGAVEGAVIHVELDGVNISGPIPIPYTDGGLRRFTTITKPTPTLAAGNHELRVIADQAAQGRPDLAIALNYIEFAASSR